MNRVYSYGLLIGILCVVLSTVAACSTSDDDDDDTSTDDDVSDDDTVGDDDTTDDDADDDNDDDDIGDDDTDDDDDDDDDNDDDADDDADDDSGDDDSGEAELIVNGGFETGDNLPWVGDWYGDLVFTEENIYVYDGVYAAWLGGRPNAHEWIQQTGDIPSDLESGKVTMAYRTYRGFAKPTSGGGTIGLWNAEGTTELVNLVTLGPADFPLSSNDWVLLDYDLTPADIEAIAGKEVALRIDLSYDGG